MNKGDALEEVTKIGIAYFQDWISDFETSALAVDSILEQIRDDASGSKLTGLGLWEVREEVLRVAMQEAKADELDLILEYDYGLSTESAGGSKMFFSRLHMAVLDGINEARQRNS